MDNLTILLISVVISFLLGALAATISIRRSGRSEVEKACENLRKEFETEKKGLGDQLGQELSRMRDSLLKTLEAYEGAAKVIEEKFDRQMPHTAIEGSAEPVALDFYENSVSDERNFASFSESKNSRTKEEKRPVDLTEEIDSASDTEAEESKLAGEDRAEKDAFLTPRGRRAAEEDFSQAPHHNEVAGGEARGSKDARATDEEELNGKYNERTLQ